MSIPSGLWESINILATYQSQAITLGFTNLTLLF
jgi:hypothetical protein